MATTKRQDRSVPLQPKSVGANSVRPLFAHGTGPRRMTLNSLGTGESAAPRQRDTDRQAYCHQAYRSPLLPDVSSGTETMCWHRIPYLRKSYSYERTEPIFSKSTEGSGWRRIAGGSPRPPNPADISLPDASRPEGSDGQYRSPQPAG